MKVLLVNGSPKAKGCTYTALKEVEGVLLSAGLETEWFQVGFAAVHPCTGCHKCRQEGPGKGRCVFDDDAANKLGDMMVQADAIVVGSPVYYAGPSGALCALLERAFYTRGKKLRFKPAAALVSCRRAGSTAALDRLYKFFAVNRMPIVTSQYWAMVHGSKPEDVMQDEEGLETMRSLGEDMAWMLKSMQEGGQPLPSTGETKRTNFIR